MDLLEDGLRALARNFSSLLLGMALIVAASALYFFSTAAAIQAFYPELLAFRADTSEAGTPETEAATENTAELSAVRVTSIAPPEKPAVPAPTLGPPPVALVLFNIAAEVLFAIAIALIYALVFARFGSALDRPLWKCGSTAEAVRRFFTPWFIITLIPFALRDAQGNSGSIEIALAIEVLLIVFGPFFVPIGACVMHHGALDWEEIGEILAPIGRQFRMVIPILLVGLSQYTLQIIAGESLPKGPDLLYAHAAAASLLNAPFWILDVLMFCMMWRVCMLDRDAGLRQSANYGDE